MAAEPAPRADPRADSTPTSKPAPMIASMIVTDPGPAARAALWEEVAAAKAADPLAPVTVVAPSTYAALSLRRELATRWSGVVNVNLVAMNRLAELLGAPLLSRAGRQPLDTATATEATRLALIEVAAPGLEPEPRTVAAVNTTLRDAIRAGITPHGAIGDVCRAGRARLSAYYDDEDQLEAAANAIDDGRSGLDDVGHVVWFHPRHVTPGTATFARALARRGRLGVVGVRTRDDRADTVLDDVARAIGCDLPSRRTGASPVAATRLVVAPDPDTEVRAVAQEVLALAADGVPFRRMNVSYAAHDPYARLVHERFTAARIPLAGPAPRSLGETAAGRVVVGLLRCLDEDLARDAVVDLLTCAPLRPDLASSGAVARWDGLSAEAGVVSGAAGWRDRLATWTSRLPTLESPASDHHVGDATLLGELVDALIPADHSWTGRGSHAAAVLDRLLGDGAHLVPEEQEALGAVRDTLAGLARLDALGGDTTAFDETVSAALDTPFGRAGVVGSGVLVAPMASLAGTAADVVFVLGLSESATASDAIDDPLLPGHGLMARRRDEHRAAYLGALASAERRIVSFPRADLRAARAVMPSPWLRESAAALAGRPIAATELLTPGSSRPWLRVIPSLEELVTVDPPSADEAALAALLAWRHRGGQLDSFPLDGSLRVGFEALTARRHDVAGAWDGVVGKIEGLAPDDERPFSATRLESWATCPFRYFMRSVLGTDELERPEALERIEPRVKGSLVHDALREFLAGHVGRPPSQPWSSAERAELAAIVARHADDAERRGLVGRPALWAIDRRRLLADADAFLDVDQELRAALGVSPWLQEVGFGDGEHDELAPLDLELDGRFVRFRGRIDRIDRSPDGSLVEVYDYKTGHPHDERLVDDPVAAGTLLQPVLYGLVARRELPSGEVGSHYWFTRARGADGLDGVVVDDAATNRLDEALTVITRAIAEGRFPREPGADGYFGPENCRYCPYDRACPSDRVRVAEARYPDDPGFEALRVLRSDHVGDGEDGDE